MGEKYNPKNLVLKGQSFAELKKETKSKSQLQRWVKYLEQNREIQ